MNDVDRFPNCMHALAAALLCENVDPKVITITLPKDDWWRLWEAVENKHGLGKMRMRFDSDTLLPREFTFRDFKFVMEKK
jgi:hypothetical protein